MSPSRDISCSSPEWHVSAEAWVDQALRQAEIQQTTPFEIFHVRPWSCVARCTSSAGDLFFKSCEPQFRHEAGLVNLLSARHPDCTPIVLAVDPRCGWLLMKAAGLRLREQLTGENWLDHWKKVITRYAKLQIDLISYSSALLQLGLPDRSPRLLADRLETILGEVDMLMLGEPEGLRNTDLERLHELFPTIRERCGQLSLMGIPDSLNHGDFHDANIFLQGERYTFLDWGDASLTHPFFSLRTAFVSLENTLGLAENAPIFDLLRDSYLEAWEAFCDRDKLLNTFDLAQRLWSLGSLLSWHQSIAAWPPEERGEYQAAIPSLLHELLEANND